MRQDMNHDLEANSRVEESGGVIKGQPGSSGWGWRRLEMRSRRYEQDDGDGVEFPLFPFRKDNRHRHYHPESLKVEGFTSVAAWMV